MADISNLFRSAVPPVTDEQAMWRIRMDDDPQTFAEIVQRWERPIHRLCIRMIGDEHRGEDIAQEVFTRLFTRRKDYEPTGKFSTFIWRIAVNLCYDELRRIKRRRESSLDQGMELEVPTWQPAATEPGPDCIAADNDRGEFVRQALARLSEPYRAVVILRHYEGLKFREIGELLEIPEGTVKSRMAEALTQLGRLLYPVLRKENNSPEYLVL